MNYKVGFAKSSRAKRVQFANLNLGVTEMLAERVRKSKLNRGFGNSGFVRLESRMLKSLLGIVC